MPWGPKRVPGLYVVPVSRGAPRIATSASSTWFTYSRKGDFRNVPVSPAKGGSSPRTKVEMERSPIDSAASSPCASERSFSSWRRLVGSSSSALWAQEPSAFQASERGGEGGLPGVRLWPGWECECVTAPGSRALGQFVPADPLADACSQPPAHRLGLRLQGPHKQPDGDTQMVGLRRWQVRGVGRDHLQAAGQRPPEAPVVRAEPGDAIGL